MNYKESLENGLIPNGLKINKRPAIKPVTEDFLEKWNSILLDAKSNLVQLLLRESLQVVEKLDKELERRIKKIYPNHVKEKRIQLKKQYENYKKKLESRRFRKWKKVEEKNQVRLETVNRKGTEQLLVIDTKLPQMTETEPLVETNDEHVQIELDESNITDKRKARKKMKTVTYSEVVKGTERKDIGEKVISLEEIKANVLRDSLNQTYETTPPVLCCDSSICKNSSEQLGFNQQFLGDVLSSQDDELVGILEDLQNEKIG